MVPQQKFALSRADCERICISLTIQHLTDFRLFCRNRDAQLCRPALSPNRLQAACHRAGIMQSQARHAVWFSPIDIAQMRDRCT
jgi:hypothetical protein